MRFFYILIGLFILPNIHAQPKSNIKLIQGAWANNFNSDSSWYFIVNKNNKSLGISIFKGKQTSDNMFFLREQIVGFQNYQKPFGENEMIQLIL